MQYDIEMGSHDNIIIAQGHGSGDKLRTQEFYLPKNASLNLFEERVRNCDKFEQNTKPPFAIYLHKEKNGEIGIYLALNTVYDSYFDKLDSKTTKSSTQKQNGKDVKAACKLTKGNNLVDEVSIYVGKNIPQAINRIQCRGYTSKFRDNGIVKPGFIQIQLNEEPAKSFIVHFGNNDRKLHGGGGTYNKLGMYLHHSNDHKQDKPTYMYLKPIRAEWQWGKIQLLYQGNVLMLNKNMTA